jgi:hypothetical protein
VKLAKDLRTTDLNGTRTRCAAGARLPARWPPAAQTPPAGVCLPARLPPAAQTPPRGTVPPVSQVHLTSDRITS